MEVALLGPPKKSSKATNFKPTFFLYSVVSFPIVCSHVKVSILARILRISWKVLSVVPK